MNSFLKNQTLYKNIINMLVLVFVSSIFFSCGTKKIEFEDVGRLSIGSTKNVELKGDYELLSRNAGFDASQIMIANNARKRSTRKTVLESYVRLRSQTISGAIDNVVEGTPGGIYMENVELYHIADKTSKKWDYYIVSGDVYGLKNQTNQIRGYKIGTKAFYKRDSGEVVTLIDDQRCLWKRDKDDKYFEVFYDTLTKIGE